MRTDIEGLWSEEDVTVGNVYIIRFYKAGYEFSDNNLEVTAEAGGTEVPTVTSIFAVLRYYRMSSFTLSGGTSSCQGSLRYPRSSLKAEA